MEAAPRPRRKKSKFKLLFLPIIMAIIAFIAIAALVFWVFTGTRALIMSWEPQTITFYSQLKIPDNGNDSFFADGKIDGGFNESVYEGAYEYSKYKNYDLDIESQIGVTDSNTFSSDPADYLHNAAGIDAQYKAGAETVISSGFNLALAVQEMHSADYVSDSIQYPDFSDEAFVRRGWKTIVIDDSMLAPQFESAVSVTYNASDAGFLAGLAASIYTLDTLIHNVQNGEAYNDDIVTWGGDAFDTVYDWMSGFEQAINYFNYKVLGIDVLDNTYAGTANETLGLISTLGIDSSEDIANGMDLTNGYSLTPDYSGSFESNNEIGQEYVQPQVNKSWKESWYVGSFESDKEHWAGEIANNRANTVATNNVPVVFPVAGGQYLRVTDTFNQYEESGTLKDSMIIGVDVDGTQSDVAGADHYLGSATKNLKDAAALTIWSVDKDIDQEDPKYQTQFGSVTTENFMSENSDDNPLGWKDSSAEKGDLYRGTYQNGGVGFVEGLDNGGTVLENSYENLAKFLVENTILEASSVPTTFFDFAEMAFDENVEKVGGIEFKSNTFTSNGNVTSTDANAAPWIPNWAIYTNEYTPIM